MNRRVFFAALAALVSAFRRTKRSPQTIASGAAGVSRGAGVEVVGGTITGITVTTSGSGYATATKPTNLIEVDLFQT